MAQTQDIEVRIALLEEFKDRTLEHHRQTMDKLDIILKMLNQKDCALHAARLLQVETDLIRIRDVDVKEIRDKQDSTSLRMAVWSGAFAVLAFLAGKIFK